MCSSVHSTYCTILRSSTHVSWGYWAYILGKHFGDGWVRDLTKLGPVGHYVRSGLLLMFVDVEQKFRKWEYLNHCPHLSFFFGNSLGTAVQDKPVDACVCLPNFIFVVQTNCLNIHAVIMILNTLRLRELVMLSDEIQTKAMSTGGVFLPFQRICLLNQRGCFHPSKCKHALKHNDSNEKSDFLWVDMFQTLNFPLETSAHWHSKCFISK